MATFAGQVRASGQPQQHGQGPRTAPGSSESGSAPVPAGNKRPARSTIPDELAQAPSGAQISAKFHILLRFREIGFRTARTTKLESRATVAALRSQNIYPVISEITDGLVTAAGATVASTAPGAVRRACTSSGGATDGRVKLRPGLPLPDGPLTGRRLPPARRRLHLRSRAVSRTRATPLIRRLPHRVRAPRPGVPPALPGPRTTGRRSGASCCCSLAAGSGSCLMRRKSRGRDVVISDRGHWPCGARPLDQRDEWRGDSKTPSRRCRVLREGGHVAGRERVYCPHPGLPGNPLRGRRYGSGAGRGAAGPRKPVRARSTCLLREAASGARPQQLRSSPVPGPADGACQRPASPRCQHRQCPR